MTDDKQGRGCPKCGGEMELRRNIMPAKSVFLTSERWVCKCGHKEKVN